MYQYPYGNAQQLNLDWILSKIQELEAGSTSVNIEEVANALVSASFDAGVSYRRYDYCFYNGKLYRALNDTTGAFNPADWLEVVVGDDIPVLTRLLNAVDASLTTLQEQVAELDSDDVDNASNVTGTTVSNALDNLNGALIVIRNDITQFIETGSTASRNYGIGDLIIYDGRLCKTITPIASGATFTLGTNLSYTSLRNEFAEITDATEITAFANNWETNGLCFYQRTRNVYHLHCVIRNGDNDSLILNFGSSLAPASISSAIIMGVNGYNGYVTINTSGQVIVHNVTALTSVFFDLYWVH